MCVTDQGRMSVQINSVSVSRVCGVLLDPSFRDVAGQQRLRGVSDEVHD